MSSMGWIGFDFDGTLAKHESGSMELGAPIAPMVELAKEYLKAGYEVRIVTARAAGGWRPQLHAWCLEHIGRMLVITDRKDYDMLLLYDDRAVSVEPNTGRTLGFRV